MEKITPQIAALYIGQKCDVHWDTDDEYEGAFKKGDIWYDSRVHGSHINRLGNGEFAITLYLRPLGSITEEECREIYQLTGSAWGETGSCKDFWWESFEEENLQNKNHYIGDPEVWLYLLKKGFDLFKLIPKGFAKEITQ